MAVCAPTTSSSRLNPNAPFFVPAAFCAVEDFSPDWWHFIQSSPAFREYWLTERFDPELTSSDLDLVDLLDFESEEFMEEDEGDDPQEDMPDSSMDLKDFARLAGLDSENTHSKLSRRPFSPLPYQDKPLKVTRPQKPGMRKIQQPR